LEAGATIQVLAAPAYALLLALDGEQNSEGSVWEWVLVVE
jgi:hypothetical protein